MPITTTTTEQIDQLLHDAHRAERGAEFAMEVGDQPAAARLQAKAHRLLSEAEQLQAPLADAGGRVKGKE